MTATWKASRWRRARRAWARSAPIRHVFLMTGAMPNTRGWTAAWRWTSGLRQDRRGPDARGAEAAGWPLGRAPHLLETSLPGVFAVGDVRSGNVKRVASAVGEGSICVQLVHKVLAE